MKPRQGKPVRRGSRGGRSGTHIRRYSARSTNGRPNVEAWRPVRIGTIIEELLDGGFEVEGEQ
jgi:hypothetical protein